MNLRTDERLNFVGKFAGYDGCDGRTFERAGVEGGVAGLAGRGFYVVGPRMGGGENGYVGGLARG